MKRVLLTCCVLTLVSLVPRPASADSLLDPIIGIRGAKGGSPEITDSSPQGFVACGELGFEDLSGYICSAYNLGFEFVDGLYAVDLSFEKLGQDIPVSEIFLDELSDFSQMEVVDENTVRLFGGSGTNGALACDNEGTNCVGGANGGIEILSTVSLFSFLAPGDDAIVFLREPCKYETCGAPNPLDYTVSATNPQNTPVPEPGTLLLMGVGLAGVAGRRFRQRAS